MVPLTFTMEFHVQFPSSCSSVVIKLILPLLFKVNVFRNPLNTCSKLSELQDKIYDLWYNSKKKKEDKNTFDNMKDTIHKGTQNVEVTA